MAEVVAPIKAVVPRRRSPSTARRCRSRPSSRRSGSTATSAPFPRTPLRRGRRGDDRPLPALAWLVKVRLAYGEHGLDVELPDDRSTVIVPLHQQPAPDATAEVVRALRRPARGQAAAGARPAGPDGRDQHLRRHARAAAPHRRARDPRRARRHRRPRRRRDPRRDGHAPRQHARGAARDAGRRGRRLGADRQPRRAGRRVARRGSAASAPAFPSGSTASGSRPTSGSRPGSSSRTSSPASRAARRWSPRASPGSRRC